MTNLKTALLRKNETAANAQRDVREEGPRGYRAPKAKPIILANRVHMRRYQALHRA